jgi:RNA polymerase sigma-B factor
MASADSLTADAEGPADPADPTDPLEGFRRYRADPDRVLRNELVEQHLGLAYHVAARFMGRGLEAQDLRQIAAVGLVKAVDRFDPDRGVAFATFARPFVLGEVRHHFRDAGWEMHVPRPIKARAQRVRAATEALRTRLAREPRVSDLAVETGFTEDEVIEALDAARVTRTRRFDATDPSGDQTDELHPAMDDPGIAQAEHRVLLEELLEELDERDRTIVVARFVQERTQQEIAEDVGVSQVHVSRLLRRILAELRSALPDDPSLLDLDER